MSFRNRAPFAAYPAHIRNQGAQNHHRQFDSPQFANNINNPQWGSNHARQNFNINGFMYPPGMVNRPEFDAGNKMFGHETYAGSQENNFQFTGQQSNQCPQIMQGQPDRNHQNFQNNQGSAQNFQGHSNGNNQRFHANWNNNKQFNGHLNNNQQFRARWQGDQYFPGPQNGDQHFHGPQNGDQHFHNRQNGGQHFHGQQNGGQHFHGGQYRNADMNNQGQQGGFFKGGRQGPWAGTNRGFNRTQHNNNKNKKKLKVDKRDLEENNVFFCDICDRGFKTAEKYKEHMDGHTKCQFKDCPFVAAPKLVALHMRMQHRSGMAKKVWSVETEEEIKKWREDRKRNFPTEENVKKKLEEKEKKVARGELLVTQNSGKKKKPHRNRRGGRGRGNAKTFTMSGNNGEVKVEDVGNDDSGPDEVAIQKSTAHDDAVTGDGAGKNSEVAEETLINGGGVEATSSVVTVEVKTLFVDSVEVEAISGVDSVEVNQSSLVSCEELVDKVVASAAEHKETSSSDKLNVSENPNNNTDSNEAVPADGLPQKTKPKCGKRGPQSKSESEPRVKRNKTDHGRKQQQQRYTLLQKLLATDVRRERNKILQCVHFIVKNKFFHK